MSRRTNKYSFGYFDEGDRTSPTIEMQRFETLDVQLQSIFDIMGNGIIEGWELIASSGLNVIIAPGKGHVAFVATESIQNETITLVPNSINYIYAQLTNDSYWTKSVAFATLGSFDSGTTNVFLGCVTTNSTEIIEVDQTCNGGRKNLGFLELIQNLIKNHRHIGGATNPPPVDLSSEVQGIIGQENLPDLDASVIKTGLLNSDRFPKFDHIAKLINQGTLTHAQLDSYVESLSASTNSLMGETSTVNLLQLILAIKHVYPDIDEFLVNEIAYIPGISPDSYVDMDNTTATVDYLPASSGGTHTITGDSAPGQQTYTQSWSSNAHFNIGTKNNTIVIGDTVHLDTTENTLSIDDFNSIQNWTIVTNDISSLPASLTIDASTFVNPPSSGKLSIGDQEVEIALEIKKDFDAQNWTSYKFLVFYIKTESVQHGDIFFFLNDVNGGTQSSFTKVLDRNSPTVNIDTLQNGWQEVRIDITGFTRSAINHIGFYVSTQDGWDTSKGFDFNIDQVFLTTGSIYQPTGYIRLVFGSDFLYDFWRLRWDTLIPSDVQSTGIEFKVRSRVSNDGITYSSWSAFSSVSGTLLTLDTLYKYIEIEAFFTASTDQSRTAVLRKLQLDFFANDVDSSFTYNDLDDWQAGCIFNIDVNSSPDAIQISNTDELGDTIFGSDGYASQLNEDFENVYRIGGSALPKTTYQALNSLAPSFGLITGVARGNNGNIWVADIDNDIVVEVDKSGALIRSFMGSFLNAPSDPYGTEENGPGSNTDVQLSVATSTPATSLSVLHTIYNPEDGALYIVFNTDLENIYDSGTTLNLDKMFLKIGTQRFNLSDSKATLVGVNEVKYNNWNGVFSADNEDTRFLEQFKFTSHILKLEPLGADRTALDFMVNQTAPSIVVHNPVEQERITTNFITVRFLLYNFVLGNQAGENAVRVSLNGNTPEDIFDDKITFNNLSNGVHVITAQLLGTSGLETNIEATATVSFVVTGLNNSAPWISITTPKQNQIYSSSPVQIEFVLENFPIIPTGQHIAYQLDSDPNVSHNSTGPIYLEDIEPGSHTITLTLVDENGVSLGYAFGSATTTFIVGLNSNARTKLHINRGSVTGLESQKIAIDDIIDVYVGNCTFQNIYSPIDVQIIASETSIINNGKPTIVVSKLRSPSWTDALGDSDNVVEFLSRLSSQAAGESTTTTTTTTSNSLLASVPTAELIYESKFLNGHSVVQFNMESELIMSNNAARFASSKSNAKSLLGSAEKIGDNEILIADPVNKRALVTYTDLSKQVSLISWQYDSDRFISDFHLINNETVTISIRNDSVGNSNLYVRQGSTIIWENNSSAPVTVYSGTTSSEQFNLDPDLNLFGDEFFSSVLQPGESFSFKFVSVGIFGWFVYPSILTGIINVTTNRLSADDRFLILENDGLESPFSSRVLKVDTWGNILWSFGSSYLVKPRDARPLFDGSIVIST